MSEYKQRIVLMRDARYPTTTTVVAESSANAMGDLVGYVTISEAVDVEFPPRKQGDFVRDAVALLDGKIAEVRAKAAQAVTELEESQQRLLALTYQAREASSND
jgi:hypothetical protein